MFSGHVWFLVLMVRFLNHDSVCISLIISSPGRRVKEDRMIVNCCMDSIVSQKEWRTITKDKENLVRLIIFVHSFHFLISFIQLWRAHHHPQSACSLELRLSIFVQGLFWILRDVMYFLFIVYISLSSLLVVGQWEFFVEWDSENVKWLIYVCDI